MWSCVIGNENNLLKQFTKEVGLLQKFSDTLNICELLIYAALPIEIIVYYIKLTGLTSTRLFPAKNLIRFFSCWSSRRNNNNIGVTMQNPFNRAQKQLGPNTFFVTTIHLY